MGTNDCKLMQINPKINNKDFLISLSTKMFFILLYKKMIKDLASISLL